MTSALDTKPIFTDYVRYGTLTVMAGQEFLTIEETANARQKSQGYHKILPTKAAQELDRILFDG